MTRWRAATGLTVTMALVACAPPPSAGPSASGTARAATPPASPATTSQPSETPAWSPLTTVTLRPPSDGAIVTDADLAGPTLAGYLAVAGQRRSNVPWSLPNRLLLVAGSADGRTWQTLDPMPFSADNLRIAGSGLGWVLVTSGIGSESNTTPWYSADGRTWGMDHDPPAATIDGAPEDLVAGPSGFALVVARRDDPNVRAIWSSRDGRHWAEARGLPNHDVQELRITRGGFVAVLGHDLSQPYVSDDGVSWRAGPAGPALRPGGWVTTWIPTDDGAIALVDDDTGAGPQPVRLRVASGPDGPVLDWATTAPTSVFTGAGISAGAGNADRFVMLGYDASYRSLSWTSIDGLAWTRHLLPEATFGGGVPGTIGGGAPFVAMGWRGDRYGQVVRQPWVSDDGVTWTAVSTDGLGTLTPPPGACPTARTFDVDGAWIPVPATQYAACFRGATLHLRGWARDCGGCGGTGPLAGTPSWLLDPLGLYPLYLGGRTPGKGLGGGGFGMVVAPGVALPAGVPSFEAPAHVEVTGHFADAASSTCRLRQDPSVGGQLEAPVVAIARCEATFVITGVRRLP